MGSLGIVAGGGDLPARLGRLSQAGGRDVFVLLLDGQADDGSLADFPHARVRLGQLRLALSALRAAGVEDLVFAGKVQRPTLASLRPDWQAAKFLAKIGLSALGDDSLMRAVIRLFEAEGFRVVAPEALMSDLLAPSGPIGTLAPDETALTDIRRGVEVAQALGRADAGQGVVVQQGIVLAIEAAENTDAMLVRAGTLRREGPGGVLVKVRKPQQERRIDLPTIGAATVANAAAAGLRGIAVEAGGALVLDRAAVAAAADAAGLFVVGIDVGHD